MSFSVQQIKFEFLSVIKEFGGDGRDWQVALSDSPPAEALAREGLDPADYVFIGKPAASPRAAVIVREFMTGRCRVAEAPSADGSADLHWIYLFREKASLPPGGTDLHTGVPEGAPLGG